MKTIVSEYQFVDSFRACGRESQFSVPARRALFEYFERLEEETDTETTLDPVAVCCEFAEYPSAISAAQAYGYEDEIDGGDESAIEYMRNRTQVIEFEGGVVIQQF